MMEHPIVLNNNPLSSPEHKAPLAFVPPAAAADATSAAAAAPVALWAQQVRMLQQQKQQQRERVYNAREGDDDESISIASSSSDFDDDDDDDITEEEERQENAVAKALVKAAFDRRLGAPVLKRLVASAVNADDDNNNNNVNNNDEPPLKKPRLLRRVSFSEPAISSMPLHDNSKTPSPTVIVQQQEQQPSMNNIKPDDLIKNLVESHGYVYQTFPALELPNFFEPISPESVAAYDMTVLQAVRQQDVATLQRLHQEGRNLQCGNRFGETVVHTAARRGSQAVLQFLLHQAGVSVRVCCDYGRTALHDACWTAASDLNLDVISFLLDECPDLLYTTDRRGFTPLAYIRATASAEWCQFLQERGIEGLLPKELQLKKKEEWISLWWKLLMEIAINYYKCAYIANTKQTQLLE